MGIFRILKHTNHSCDYNKYNKKITSIFPLTAPCMLFKWPKLFQYSLFSYFILFLGFIWIYLVIPLDCRPPCNPHLSYLAHRAGENVVSEPADEAQEAAAESAGRAEDPR